MDSGRTEINFGSGNLGVEVGQNFGPINVQYHNAFDQHEVPPEPFSTVPFTKDPDYVHHPAFDAIRTKLKAPAARVALVGLGGVGKSQLAIQYAYWIRESSPNTWVLWLHASTAPRLEQSVRDLLNQLKVRGRNDPKVDAFMLLRDWLRHTKENPWLVVLDNVDNADVLLGFPSTPEQSGSSHSHCLQRRIDYFPFCSQGTTLITSRSKGIATQLAERRNVVGIQPMGEDLAEALLSKKLEEPQQSEDLIRLANSLDFMPLAMVQAAAYINHRAPLCSIQDYIRRLEANNPSGTRLLRRDEGDLRRDRDASNSIIRTWEVSFDHISSLRPSAADLLSLMSFFDRQGMPKALLEDRGYGKEEEWVPKVSGYLAEPPNGASTSSAKHMPSPYAPSPADDDFEDDISMLRDYAFIHSTTEPSSFGMHRLVQVATRTWLEKNEAELEKWRFRFVANLEKAFSGFRAMEWFQFQPLFPHAKRAVEENSEDRHFILRKASLLFWSAEYARHKGLFTDAEEMLLCSLAAREGQHGAESLEATDCLETLSVVKLEQGLWEQAELLQVRAINNAQRSLGESHYVTLSRESRLARIYSNQNRMAEAEALRFAVYQKSKTGLGRSHKITLAFLSDYARVLRQRNRWNESEAFSRLVCKKMKEVAGEKDVGTLMCMQDLARTLQYSGRLKEAERLQVKVVGMYKSVVGESHQLLLDGQTALASIYTYQERFEEAEALQALVVEKIKDMFGATNPQTLYYMSTLGDIYCSVGQFEKAASLELEILQIHKDNYGIGHPSTVDSTCRLARVYSGMRRLSDAEELYMDVIDRRRTIFGDNDLMTLSVISELASIYWTQKRHLQARKLQLEVVHGYNEQLGDKHPESLRRMWLLADIVFDLGNREDALLLMEGTLSVSVDVLGPEHPDTIKRRRWLEEWREADRNLRNTGRF
ncbi:hypothetical protein WHR41_06554 [Cladosporium halotolerans]|uniref:Uncharacterized protein n=1 Tax=Cladosporium halotolerans TaxID=1052096 RepID=A0AB34KJ59_9PEZI